MLPFWAKEHHSAITARMAIAIKVNVTSQFQTTQSLMPVLEKSKNASVVFTSSSVGRVGRAFWGAYAVSKFAVEGMVQTWASELEGLNNVRINCINPGATATPMRAQAYPAENPQDSALLNRLCLRIYSLWVKTVRGKWAVN